MTVQQQRVAEIERIRRVADQTCTGHAILRDQYATKSVLLDLLILAGSTWLTAVAFLDEKAAASLTPFTMEPRVWVGFLGLVTFFATIAQLRVDWKAKAEAHKRSAEVSADVKRAAAEALADNKSISTEEFRRIVALQAFASASGVAIPDSQFLSLKRHHKMKIAVSRHLDQHPGASVTLTKLKFFWRDNF